MARGAVPVVPAPAPPGTTSVWVRSNGMPVVTTKIAATNTAIPTTPEVMRWFRRWRSRRRSSRSEAGWGTGMRRAMRSSVGSGLFLIMILHRGFQGRSSVRSERADGGGRDAEGLGCVLAPKIEEIHEHERGALALRELAERTDDLVAEVGGGEGGLGRTGVQVPVRGPGGTGRGAGPRAARLCGAASLGCARRRNRRRFGLRPDRYRYPAGLSMRSHR